MTLRWEDGLNVEKGHEDDKKKAIRSEGIYHGVVKSVKLMNVRKDKVYKIVYKLLDKNRTFSIEEFLPYDIAGSKCFRFYKRYNSIVKGESSSNVVDDTDLDLKSMINVPVLVTLSRVEVGDKDSLYISDVVRDDKI